MKTQPGRLTRFEGRGEEAPSGLALAVGEGKGALGAGEPGGGTQVSGEGARTCSCFQATGQPGDMLYL